MAGRTGGATGPHPIEAPEAVRRHWIWLAILGAFLIATGLFAIGAPIAAGFAATIVIGVGLLIGGAIQAWHAVKCAGWRPRAWNAVSALIYLLGGVLLLFQPLAGIIALSLLVMAILIAGGAVRIVMGFRMRPERGWSWMVVSGAISLLLGLGLALFAPVTASLTLLGAAVAASLIAEGAAYVYLAFAARPASDRQITPDAA